MDKVLRNKNNNNLKIPKQNSKKYAEIDQINSIKKVLLLEGLG